MQCNSIDRVRKTNPEDSDDNKPIEIITKYDGVPVERFQATHKAAQTIALPTPMTKPDVAAAVHDSDTFKVESMQVSSQQEESLSQFSRGKQDATAADIDENDDCMEYNADSEQMGPIKPEGSTSSHKKKRTLKERQCSLDNDEWADKHEANRVFCKGCHRWIKMHRAYDLKDWETHKSKCSTITGMEAARIARIRSSKPSEKPAGTQPLASFFTPLAPKPMKEPLVSVPFNKYVIKKIKVLPFSSRTLTLILFPKKTARLWGQTTAARELLENHTKDPARQLPPAVNTLVFTAVPDWGTKEPKEEFWTEKELRMYDHFLRGWARWEVDYVNGFVKATNCNAATESVDWLCTACRLLTNDDSFKHALRKASKGIFTRPIHSNQAEEKVVEAKLPEHEQHDKL
ncbi:hypothetical protein HWV62_3246, partial [Athelia sp. TMB]